MNLKPATLAAAIGLAGSFGAHAAEKDIAHVVALSVAQKTVRRVGSVIKKHRQ